MRLREEEVYTLKECAKALASDARLYLFGSRTDDRARGGDIDLLIVSNDFDRKKVRSLRLEFFKRFGEQKLDIVVDDGSFSNPFHRIIIEKALPL
jgi:predicted nucleotidyltransferase